MDINKIAKEYTREEFLNSISCDEYGNVLEVLNNKHNICPDDYGLEEDCGGHCINECWAKAIKDIKFKGEDMRRDKDNYYLDIAEVVLERSTCLRRQYGAIIVNNDEIISTGYTGSPRGKKNCCDIGECERIKNNVPHGTDYTHCESVHAEQNAIISASRKDMIGSTLYLVGIQPLGCGLNEYVENAEPCSICKRLIINAGIKKVIARANKDKFKTMEVEEWK